MAYRWSRPADLGSQTVPAYQGKKGRPNNVGTAFLFALLNRLLRCRCSGAPVVGDVDEGFFKVSHITLSTEVHDSSNLFPE